MSWSMKSSLSSLASTKIHYYHCHPRKKTPLSVYLLSVIIGDSNGVISAYVVKEGAITCKFKTQPDAHEISAMLYDSTNERIFYSCAHEIKAINRKGKQVFRYDTFTTETINFLYLRPKLNIMYAGGSFVLNMLEICDSSFKDRGCYIFQDKIKDMILLGFNEGYCLVALAGKECVLLNGNTKATSLILQNGVTTLLQFPNIDSNIVFGTANGTIGILRVTLKCITVLWEKSTQENSQITGLHYGNILRV